MQILSINFGHDASLAYFSNGKLLEFLELERHTRLKHHSGIRKEYIDKFLESIDKNLSDIDLVTTAATQEWRFPHCREMNIRQGYSSRHEKLFPATKVWSSKNYFTLTGPDNYRDFEAKNLSYSMKLMADQDLNLSDNWLRKPGAFDLPFCEEPNPNKDRLKSVCDNFSANNEELNSYIQRHFIHPMVIEIGDITLPALHVDHHAAHANYAGYYSGGPSIIVTHDGGRPDHPFNSGGVYLYNPKSGLLPIASHNLFLGTLYDFMAKVCCVDTPGKLMGLSSYAIPSPKILQLADEIISIINDKIRVREGSLKSFEKEVLRPIAIKIIKISMQDINIKTRSVEKYNFSTAEASELSDECRIQIAANTQELIQHVFVKHIGNICLKIKEVLPELNKVFMTGGFALNCPTNSALNQSYSDLNFIPLPAVGDTGLSLGAAIAAIHFTKGAYNVDHLSDPLAAAFPPSTFDHNFCTIADNYKQIKFNSHEKLIQYIADKLKSGMIIGLHRGRSEVGPRALGHRSIIALAGIEKNRNLINQLKRREAWRPLAPICRIEDYNEYFSGDSESCTFMLTTSKVRDERLPAVTHVDQTARVQTISQSQNFTYDLLTKLKSSSVDPVIINTSFNCAGEPIVETLNDALKSAEKMSLNYLVSEETVFELIPKKH